MYETSEVYHPKEDSFLMSSILKKQLPRLLEKKPNLKFLEIGAGSGIHLETVFNIGIKKENIFSCDINPKAVEHCNLLGFNCVQSDLFKKISGKFDVIIFNPPYLPEDRFDKEKDTTGGKKGNEIILRFLKQAKNHLNEKGKIFLITSSLAEDINFLEQGYFSKQVGCEKLFFERLCIWELDSI
ncbi:MAG: methyltransferase [Nanoarchaeota archaeon]|nr:methyltransferase [Nanoarchaeota archaeon]